MGKAKLGLILDCDGVLVDSIGAWHEAEMGVLSRRGVTLTKEERDHLNTLTLPEASAFFHESFGLGESSADVLQMINDYMMDFYSTRSLPRPGALEFVSALREQGAGAVVVSSSSQCFLQAGLGHCGFLDLLDRVISVEDYASSKRERDVFDQARAVMGSPIENTWGFDDSIFAIRTMANAGYRTVGVFSANECGTWDDLSVAADRVVSDFTELDHRDFL